MRGNVVLVAYDLFVPTKPPTFMSRLRAARGISKRPPLEHAHRMADPLQREVDRLRSSRRWRSVRAMVLRRQPLCAECVKHGVTRAATQVDHVVPLRAAPHLAFDIGNTQPLCDVCHARKSASERAARRRCP
jgi:5-methylcytosine-specific restriction endonuclease McrA